MANRAGYTRVANVIKRSLGLQSGKTLREATPREVQRALNPFEGYPYPVKQAGDLTRIPDVYIHNWINVKKLANTLRTTPPVLKALEQVALEHRETVLNTALFEALNKRGSQAFFEEWQNPEAKREITRILGAYGGKPSEANQMNAVDVFFELRDRIAQNGHAIIADLGPGSGATIKPILEPLTAEERKKVTVVLVDAMKEAVDEKAMQAAIKSGKVASDIPSAEKVVKDFGVKEIIPLHTAFDDMGKHPDFKALEGKVDVIVSGAAIHHNQSVDATFAAVAKMLKPRGLLSIWDWGHAAWKAQNLVVAPYNAIITPSGKSYRIRGSKEIIKAPENHAFISQTAPQIAWHQAEKHGERPSELSGAIDILTTWTGGTGEKGGLLKYGPEYSRKLHDYVNDKIRTGKPINFIEFLQEHLAGKKRQYTAGTREEETPTPYFFLEGHRPPELYEKSMRNAGLTIEQTKYVHDSNLLYQIRARKPTG